MKISAKSADIIRSPKSFWWLVILLTGALLALEVGWYFSARISGNKQALDSGQLVIYSLKTGEIEGLPEIMQSAASKKPESAEEKTKPEPRWKEYARPFNNPENKPVVAIIITGLGLSKASTENALGMLPEIGLSFSPYSHDVEGWIEKAVAAGAEIYMDLPMEPEDYPLSDPGAQGLISAHDEGENIRRLLMVIERYGKRVGLVSPLEEKFTAVAAAARPVLSFIYERGILFVRGKNTDSAAFEEIIKELEMPALAANIELDEVINTTDIAAALDRLVATAKQHKYAIGIARPYPVTLREIRRWAKELDAAGVILAPVSAVAMLKETEKHVPAETPAVETKPEETSSGGE